MKGVLTWKFSLRLWEKYMSVKKMASPVQPSIVETAMHRGHESLCAYL